MFAGKRSKGRQAECLLVNVPLRSQFDHYSLTSDCDDRNLQNNRRNELKKSINKRIGQMIGNELRKITSHFQFERNCQI